MKKEGYWVIRTYESGAIGEKIKFWVPGKRPEGKSRRREKSEIRKQEQNAHHAVRTLARILNANFKSGDILLGLDYAEAGMQKLEERIGKLGICMEELSQESRQAVLWDAADHEMTLALRRAKRYAREAGTEIKAVYVTSDLDGETGMPVRVHHHVVINRESLEFFQRAWNELGGVDWERLWKFKQDRSALAEYMLKQVRRIPDVKKYKCTRNMVRPVGKDRVVLNDSEIRVPKGCTLLYRQEFKRAGQPQYIRYEIGERIATGLRPSQ